jgi:hypothetical protein
MTEGMLLDLA